MGDEETAALQVATGTYTTPLREHILEIHEIFEELQVVGFDESMCSQIVAHMLTETILFPPEYSIEIDTDDDDDYPEGDLDLDDPND